MRLSMTDDGHRTGRRIRVLHLDHSVEAGGAELALARLLISPARTWEAELYVPASSEGEGVFRAAVADGAVRLTVGGGKLRAGAATSSLRAAVGFGVALIRQAWRLRRSASLRRADIVHANSTRSAVYAGLALRGRRTPLVVHLRDLVTPEALGPIGYRAFRLLAEPRADVFIANSEVSADVVGQRLRPGQRMLVIPSPIGVDRVSTPAAGGNRRVLRIGMVARLDSWKGQDVLIDAVAAAALGERVKLVLFGDAAFGKEEYRRRLDDHARESGVVVEFAGFTEDIATAIDSLDICVQYSVRPEPLGQNVLQYLARGKPVIAAKEGGPAEWITDGENGLLVKPRDPRALAAAIRELADNEELRTKLGVGAVGTAGLLSDEEVTRRHGEAFSTAHRP